MRGKAFAPANIALCKYWGKRDADLNLPVNSSLSISLGNLGTHTVVKVAKTSDRIFLNGKPAPADFSARISKFIDLFRAEGQFFEVRTKNNIPTAAKAFIGRAIRALDLWNWKRLPLIFTRAGATRTWLAKQGVDPAVVHPVYDPCDLTLYRPLPPEERAAARKKFNYQPDDIVLVHHGILHPNKGNDRIIRAVAELREQFPQLRYLLIGDGAEMSRLRELVRELKLENICTLTGWLPTLPDVNRALNAGDIGLVMRTGAQSDDFHMTGALVHNMACGLPLLAARLGGVSEVVKEGRNGFLFNPADMEEFKARLAQLIRDPQAHFRFGAAAAEDARVHFDMQRVTQNTVAPLLRLAGVKPFARHSCSA